MPGQSTLDFGSGLAQGLASVFTAKRATDTQAANAREARNAEIGMGVLNHLITSGRIESYDDLMPYVDMAFGTTGQKPKKGQPSHHDILSQVLAPTFSQAGGSGADATGVAAAPPPAGGTVTSQSVVQSMGAEPVASTASPSPIAPTGAPPAAPSSAPAPGGIRLLSDADMLQRQLSNEGIVEQAHSDRQSKLARDFYDTFKQVDPEFTLYDALAMAGFKTDYNRTYTSGASGGIRRGLDAFMDTKAEAKGSPLTPDEQLTARAEWFAQNRSGGTNREALARSMYNKVFAQLDAQQAADVIKAETTLIGGQAYSRTAGSANAAFNAPLTPTQAMTTSLPVGTTGAQVAGQSVLTQPEIDARKGTETMRTQVENIRSLVGAVLPSKSELLGNLVPGAVIAVRARTPGYREQYARLEAAVDTAVGAAARNLQQQRGAQTEKDADRAYSALVQLKSSLSGALLDPTKGDTAESASARIDETLKLIDTVMSKLPAQAAPVGKGAAAGTTPAAGLRAKARAALIKAGRQSDDATIDQFLKLNPNFKG